MGCAVEKSQVTIGGAPDMQPRIRAQLEWLQTELKALNLELHDRL